MPWPVPPVVTPAHTPTAPAVLPVGAAGITDGYTRYNKTAAMLEALIGTVFGCGAILSGLTLTAGTGLVANISAGWGVASALVDVAATLNYTCPISTTAYLWLTQAGTVTHTTTTTPPAGAVIYLGSATTSGSAITSVSLLGVVKVVSGFLWRETNEAGAPADSPSANLRLFTKTTGGLYVWNGAAWTKID